MRLDVVIVQQLLQRNLLDETIDYAFELLAWVTEELTAAQLHDDASVAVFNNLLKLASNHPDEENLEEYLVILDYYLLEQKLLEKASGSATFEYLVELVFRWESRLTPKEIKGVFEELKTQAAPNATTTAVKSSLVLLINAASYISAKDGFENEFALQSTFVENMILPKLDSSNPMPSTVCCCIVLGNLATSDKVCTQMVKDLELHLTLMELLSSDTEQAIIFAAAGFIRHLAFPTANRSILGEAGLIEACCKLLVQGDPSIRGEAAAILCKLVSDEPSNIDMVLRRPLPKDLSLAQIPGIDEPSQPTIIYHIVTQALAPASPLPSMNMKNPMIELGRTIIAIFRCLSKLPSDSNYSIDKYTQAIFQTPAIGRPVARLARQRIYPDALADGVLGLGLMAQTYEGAACVVDELRADEELLGAIKEFAYENKGGNDRGSAAWVNRRNAIMVMHGLVENGVSL